MNNLATPRAHLVERAMEAMSTDPASDTLLCPSPPVRSKPVPDAFMDGGAARKEAVTPDSLVTPDEAKLDATRQARIISMASLRAAGLAFAPNEPPRGRVAEEFSLVQQQLLRAMQAVPVIGSAACRNAVLVTSARRKEGRSFIALNLAANIAARTQQQVMLLDLDGRDTSLSQTLVGAIGPGALMPMATAIDRLSFLPHGALLQEVASRPEGALVLRGVKPSGTALAAGLRALALKYPNHILVLDMKPALAFSDVNALAATVGHVVLVVRAEETQREEVEAALDAVEACVSLHLILNETRLVTPDSFGSHEEHGAARNA